MALYKWERYSLTDGIAFRYTNRLTASNGYGSYKSGYRIITFDLNDIIVDENNKSKFSVDVGNFRVSSYKIGSYTDISVNIQKDKCFVVTGYSYGAYPSEPFSYSLSSVACGPCTVTIRDGSDSYSGDMRYTAAKSSAYYTSSAKGDYIDTITDSNESAYPTDGVQDGYYYVYKGEISLKITRLYTSSSVYVGDRTYVGVDVDDTELPGDTDIVIHYEVSENNDVYTEFDTVNCKLSEVGFGKYEYYSISSTSTIRFRAYVTASGFSQSDYMYSATITPQINVAPTTPASITYPSNIKPGVSFNISWGTSTDSNGNLSGYQLYRSLNGGSYINIYTGPNTSYQDNIPTGNLSVCYRVRAYDSKNAYSTYRTGTTVNLNSPPTTPSSISVPSSIQAGISFMVSWGTSTDSDGNLSGYTLQRRLNEGPYSTIYTGSSRSYQDTIPKSGYTSVTYRVCAYDSLGATSNYRTSNTVTIINNVAPIISGSDSNLGTFTYNPPTISYVVTDENNDTVTVTTKLDSSTLETKTVTLGQTYTISLNWWSIDSGSHTVTITANDNNGGIATRTYIFTKNSVGQISFNRLRKKTDTGYQTTYIETDSDSIITNNGQILSERLSNIADKLSVSISTTPTEMVSRHRLHIKLTSEYTIDYLEMYSTNVKVGSSTLESVLVQLESKVGISNSGTVPSNLNFERWRMKNSSGSYDIIYLEGISEHVIRPCGKTVEESLQAIEAKL